MTIRSGCRPAAAGWGALGALILFPAFASAQNTPPTREQCVSLHEKAQLSRKRGSLLQARQELRACSDEACPGLIRQDCVELLADLERALPTVTFEVVVEGQDAPSARVFDGDQLVTDGLRGLAHALNPGVHKFRAEVPGKPPIESTEVIREGEQNRVIRLEYVRPVPPPSFEPVQPAGSRPVTATTWVFSGLTLAALASGGVFGGLALAKRSQLTCAPTCSDSQVAPAKTMGIAADASFGAAVVFAGLASYFFFTRPFVPEHGPEVKPTALFGPGFGGLGLTGSF